MSHVILSRRTRPGNDSPVVPVALTPPLQAPSRQTLPRRHWLWQMLAPFLLSAGLLVTAVLLQGLWVPGAMAAEVQRLLSAPAPAAGSLASPAAPATADAAAAAVSPLPPVVGEVTLQIGQAERQRDHQHQSLSRGQDIRAGDILRTSANGHVHILFVDGARVSLRPSSVLHIQEYRYNAERPAESQIKFYLETGTVREISGRGAELARERFRLNTPLVAIGVRGTDFVTQVNDQHTAVIVNQGAIVLAPFDAACQASGLGPCQTPRARELNAAMHDMALIYQPTVPEPVLQPARSLKGLERSVPLLQPGRPLPPNPDAELGSASRPDSVVSDSRNPEHLLDVVKPSNSLVWGRWSGSPRPGDALTVSSGEAREGRQVTVGDPYYVLYRDPNTPNLLANASGTLNFRLTGASAQYRTPGNEVIAAQIDRASLSLDLTDQRFTTHLDLSAPGQRAASLDASGRIDRQTGLFVADSAASSGHVAGAVGLDLNQVGYLFQQTVGNGSVSGATLWGR